MTGTESGAARAADAQKQTSAGGSEGRLYFDEHQWSTVEAAMARIIPADADPGAREAGTVRFVDRYLSGLDYIYAKPDGSGFLKLEGKRAEAWRRRIDALRRQYATGIEELDRLGQELGGVAFCELDEPRQDRVLSEMEASGAAPPQSADDTAEAPGALPQEERAPQQALLEDTLPFFQLLVLHTRQGFYADPIYGGNKDHVGWKLIGFAGPASLGEVFDGTYTTTPFFAESGDERDR
ncbi:MAG: gluconate 2-dehydrogenase gamma chain [Solirubrobacteraceae bacterium]|jgi:gluconate 2-dehydrogenase gamma chain|nr:gluconate 2-dehydrogenase gamma chain [Solirubrobacteraceae bacterium]